MASVRFFVTNVGYLKMKEEDNTQLAMCLKLEILKERSIKGIWCHIKNSKTFFFFLINKNLKVLLKFVVKYHPTVLKLSMSVSGHRWTALEWTAT